MLKALLLLATLAATDTSGPGLSHRVADLENRVDDLEAIVVDLGGEVPGKCAIYEPLDFVAYPVLEEDFNPISNPGPVIDIPLPNGVPQTAKCLQIQIWALVEAGDTALEHRTTAGARVVRYLGAPADRVFAQLLVRLEPGARNTGNGDSAILTVPLDEPTLHLRLVGGVRDPDAHNALLVAILGYYR